MAGAAVSGRLNWLVATVTSVREDTPGVRTLTLDVPGWEGHRAGQSVDVRLTAPDGYSTQRPYSIASAPEDEAFELCVEHLSEGEVSPWLAGELREGDQFEVRGPGGRSFSWHASEGGPLLLVGGGAGIVPLRAMVRHALAAGRTDVTAVLSVRTRASLLFADEVATWPRTSITYTREGGARLDAATLAAAGPARHVFVCGPTAFVEHATTLLLEVGHDAAHVRAERFGGAS
jgi:ferredoxin-NADP reductase